MQLLATFSVIRQVLAILTEGQIMMQKGLFGTSVFSLLSFLFSL